MTPIHAPTWASDPRLAKAQAHSLRGEVLQAELLLRAVLRDHPSCVPALHGLANFATMRGDATLACQFLASALKVEPNDVGLRFEYAQALVECSELESAITSLNALLAAEPSHSLAWLLLAHVKEAAGDGHGALRARYQAVTRAQRAGRWLNQETTEPALLNTVMHHMEVLSTTRRQTLFDSFQHVRDAYGAPAVARVERALTGYLGDWDATPPDPRQRPKFLYFPDLPAGPYHDPVLQPWAGQFQSAWRDIRAEAMSLLAEDKDFESFLGLKPGQRADGYVGGASANPSWDAYFFYRRGKRYNEHHLRCPVTGAVLDAIDLCRVDNQAPEVCFSVIRPQSTIMSHYGVTNTRLVMHLPLLVPPGCALNVINGGEHHWKEGELMMFDDTFQHEAWNHSDQPRLIVLMDCWNPHLTTPERLAVKSLVQAIDGIEN